MITRLVFPKFVITRDPAARSYTDIALTPVSSDEDITLDLSNTTGAKAAVAHLRKVAALTGTPGIA
jgi:hypothetical protein